MQTLTLEQLNNMLLEATKVTPADHSKHSNTRHGSYVSITKGLTNRIVFYGIDTTTNTFVIEVVG